MHVKNAEELTNNKGKKQSSKSILNCLVNLARMFLSGNGVGKVYQRNMRLFLKEAG